MICSRKTYHCLRDSHVTRRRAYFSSSSILFEITLLGFIVWGIVVLVPPLMEAGNCNSRFLTTPTPKPILKLSATSNGKQLLVQHGYTEIVAIDLASEETYSFYSINAVRICDWHVNRDGSTFLFSADESEFLISRDQEFVVSEKLRGNASVLTQLSFDGTLAIRILRGTAARCWDLSAEVPTHIDFDLKNHVNEIALDSVGHRLVVTNLDGPIQIYDLKSGTLVRTIFGKSGLNHGIAAKSPAFSEDGRWLAVLLEWGNSIGVYDSNSGEIAWTIETDSSKGFSQLTFSPDRKWIAASGITAGIKIFDSLTGQCRHEFPSRGVFHRIAFSASSDTLYSGTTDGLIHSWSLAGHESKQLRLREQ